MEDAEGKRSTIKARTESSFPTTSTQVADKNDEGLIQTVNSFVRNYAGLTSLQSCVTMSLVVLIPLHYNQDVSGIEEPVEISKLLKTEAEIRDHFSGYSRSTIDGWYRNGDEEYFDCLLRYEILFSPNHEILQFLSRWKRFLETRFRQISIFMSFAGPILLW